MIYTKTPRNVWQGQVLWGWGEEHLRRVPVRGLARWQGEGVPEGSCVSQSFQNSRSYSLPQKKQNWQLHVL